MRGVGERCGRGGEVRDWQAQRKQRMSLYICKRGKARRKSQNF